MAAKPRRVEPRELTEEDWIALHSLLFEIGRTVCVEGVDALPPKLRALLLKNADRLVGPRASPERGLSLRSGMPADSDEGLDLRDDWERAVEENAIMRRALQRISMVSVEYDHFVKQWAADALQDADAAGNR